MKLTNIYHTTACGLLIAVINIIAGIQPSDAKWWIIGILTAVVYRIGVAIGEEP